MQEKIVLLKGDGIGPEIVDQAVSVLQAVAAKYHHGFVFNPQLLGRRIHRRVRRAVDRRGAQRL